MTCCDLLCPLYDLLCPRVSGSGRAARGGGAHQQAGDGEPRSGRSSDRGQEHGPQVRLHQRGGQARLPASAGQQSTGAEPADSGVASLVCQMEPCWDNIVGETD